MKTRWYNLFFICIHFDLCIIRQKVKFCLVLFWVTQTKRFNLRSQYGHTSSLMTHLSFLEMTYWFLCKENQTLLDNFLLN